MNASLVAGEVYHDEEWPHGLSCADCLHLFRDGERYSERLDSFVDEVPLCTIVCLGCAMTVADLVEQES